MSLFNPNTNKYIQDTAANRKRLGLAPKSQRPKIPSAQISNTMTILPFQASNIDPHFFERRGISRPKESQLLYKPRKIENATQLLSESPTSGQVLAKKLSKLLGKTTMMYLDPTTAHVEFSSFTDNFHALKAAKEEMMDLKKLSQDWKFYGCAKFQQDSYKIFSERSDIVQTILVIYFVRFQEDAKIRQILEEINAIVCE